MSDVKPFPTGAPVQSARGGSGLAIPNTLHGQLFLLAYDRCRNRVDGDDRWRFGLALHTAMLADLYMAGHLRDEDGSPCSVEGTSPDDPELRTALDAVRAAERTDWMNAVAHGRRRAPDRCSRSQPATSSCAWTRLLTVGLIGALGELPTVFGFEEAARHFEALEPLVDHAIPPITGMRRVIDAVHGVMSANANGAYST